MRFVLVVLVVMGSIVAGCVGQDAPAAGFEPASASPPPPGCDASRPAVAHRSGALLEPNAGGGLVVVPCAHPTGTTTFEPTIGIGADGAVFVYPASFIAVDAVQDGKGMLVARTVDAGASWDLLSPRLGPVPTHPTTVDPYLFLDPATGRVFVDDLIVPPFNCGSLSFSDDAGESWTSAVSGCAQFDHVTIFTGVPRGSSTLGYPNVVYRCAITGGAITTLSTMVACQRSLDGGFSWLAPGAPAFTFLPGALSGIVPGACSGGNGHGATDAEGRVYLPRGHCGEPWLAVSEDEALTWRASRVSDLGVFCRDGFCEHDAGVGVDAAGTVYYAWVAGDHLPRLAVSRDGGRTWSEPVHAGLPGLTDASHLQLAVGAPGRVALVYYASSNGPGAAGEPSGETTWNAHMAVSYDADSPDPTWWTATINDPADPLARGVCGPLRCPGIFDFIDVRIGPDGAPWAPMADACTDKCVEGGENKNQGDAFAARLWGAPSLWDDSDSNGPYP